MKTFWLIVILCLVFCPLANAQTIEDYFHRISGPESFYASSTTSGYTTTSYHDYIEVVVSGTWDNNPRQSYDACYMIKNDDSSLPLPRRDGYCFTVGFSGCCWISECGGTGVSYYTVFLDESGFVSPGYYATPPYSETHEYHFVVDFGQSLVTPTFGTGDGGVGDNSGGLYITLYQLEYNPVANLPETWGTLKALYR